MLTNCFRFAPRDSVPGIISKICKYLKEHPGWSVDELKEVIGDIETSLELGEISYFTNQSINDLDTLALYDIGYRFVFIGGGEVYSAMYALEESGGDVVANGVSLGVTESEFNQLKSIVLALNNAAYTATNPPPYPVTKVNNRTGDVKLDLADVLGESTAQTMLMSEINFVSTQLATWNAFYDYGYRVVGVLANDGSAITALYILGQNVGNHAPIPMALPSGGNVISVNGDIGEVFTLRVDPNDPGIPTDPPVPINATTLNGESAEYYATAKSVSQLSQQKADKAGWTPNKIIGTDADGNMVAVNAPEGGGGDADTLGGKPASDYLLKTEQAEDSAKLGGVEASKYAKITDIPNQTGNLSIELIWTNKNPGKTFPAHAFDVPEAADYELFLMELTPDNSLYKIQAQYVFVAKGKQLEVAYTYILNNRINVICRTIESTASGFRFTDSILNETGESTQGAHLAPYKIYGLGGVPV